MLMPIEIQGDLYLDTKEAISQLRISRPTLDALVSRGELRRYKQGVRRTHYYKQSDVERLLELKEDSDEE